MNNISIKEFIFPRLERIGVKLSELQYQQLDLLAAAMLADPMYKSVSKIFDPQEMATKHFLDSLVPLCFSLPEWKAKNIVDLGTGGGFPSLPLAVALPESHIVAIDSRQKSVEFVARMASAAGLGNVVTVHSRIEDAGRDGKFREKADLVVCRALSSVRTLVEYTMPLIKTGGSALYYKGPKLDEELAESANAFNIFSIVADNVEILRLAPPEIPFERSFLIVRKTCAVSERYPRKCGLPLEKPL
ncbi:MAG: 16S rRNA (guanine(527)-N(7))-methyltransferase RsmG [Candidatus Riflebacteria bacterium]|nr:16S rRNA (guanine(527)-N(7))-methyltransferase RsmG [Candidatus Riflebacteria bacterium]